MPFLLLPVIALVALIAAGVYFFRAWSAALGESAAAALMLLVLALIIGVPLLIWRRRRLPGQQAGAPGRYTFSSNAAELVVDVRQRLVSWRTAAAPQPLRECLFADLRDAKAVRQGDGWALRWQVSNDTVQIPMPNARAARQWQRVLQLAMTQQLPG